MRTYDLIRLMAAGIFLCLLTACDKENTPEPDPVYPDNPSEVTHVTLLYACNNSSLRYDFDADCFEAENGLAKIDDDTSGRFLIFATEAERDEPRQVLYRAVRKSDGKYVALGQPVKIYERNTTCTDPERMAQVLNDALSVYPNAVYDLFFWGHGSSWFPEFDDHQLITVEKPSVYAYGGEYTGDVGDRYNTDYADLIELADAIPDGKFRAIWFDSCYMSGIEVIYQLRNKCDIFVGYPTEIWADGLPYDIVIPQVFSSSPDWNAAAAGLYAFYNDNNQPVTVCVTDMSKLENVANAFADIVACGTAIPEERGLLDYSTSSSMHFYDFCQYAEKRAELNGHPELGAALRTSLDDMIKYRAVSARNFKYAFWDTSNFSGISTHRFTDRNTVSDAYYKRLDWTQRVGL